VTKMPSSAGMKSWNYKNWRLSFSPNFAKTTSLNNCIF